MDVTIKYLAHRDAPSGSVVRISSPYSASGFDKNRVRFMRDAGGTWCLAVEEWKKVCAPGTMAEASWHAGSTALRHSCVSGAEYAEWLAQRVDYVTVDGVTFWANPRHAAAGGELEALAEGARRALEDAGAL